VEPKVRTGSGEIPSQSPLDSRPRPGRSKSSSNKTIRCAISLARSRQSFFFGQRCAVATPFKQQHRSFLLSSPCRTIHPIAANMTRYVPVCGTEEPETEEPVLEKTRIRGNAGTHERMNALVLDTHRGNHSFSWIDTNLVPCLGFRSIPRYRRRPTW
jgi:hypothetical protein